MKVFHYKAKEGPEKIVEGKMEASDQDQVIAQLTSRGLFPLEIILQTTEKSDVPLSRFFFASKMPSLREKISFVDQLADLSSAGMTLLRAIELISKQSQSPIWRRILTNLKDSVRGGTSFSDALGKHPLVFSTFVVSMVRAGEQSGALDTCLREIAQALEREDALKSKIRQSLIYPGIILCFGLVTILVLLTFVIPRLEELYQDFGGSLPFFTKLVIGTSRILTSYGWLIAIVLTGCAIYLRGMLRSGKKTFRMFLAKLPWIGKLLDLEDTVHFTRTLGLLLKNGISIVEALAITQEIVQDRGLQEKIKRIKQAVIQGSQLARSMEELGTFTPLVVNFVQTGEETGGLDVSLEKISKIYEKEIEQRIKLLTTLLEPLLILIIGIVVGIIVVSMLLPIFQISLLVH